jgi:hypothetical protein
MPAGTRQVALVSFCFQCKGLGSVPRASLHHTASSTLISITSSAVLVPVLHLLLLLLQLLLLAFVPSTTITPAL